MMIGTTGGKTQCDFQWMNLDFLLENPDFLFKNLDFLLKNPDFLLKNVECIIKTDNAGILLAGLLVHFRGDLHRVLFGAQRRVRETSRGRCIKNDEFCIKNDEFCI